ncbi:MAG: hypothetical protein JO271_07245 [Verrucomicrobia bacterium]|nr:hypothetical protein [Verrucomicrobiota bacterium]
MYDKPVALVTGPNQGFGCDPRSLTQTVRRAVRERARATPMVRQSLPGDRHLDFRTAITAFETKPPTP